MRLFELQRDVDVSGASGTGRVAQGVVFDDGRVAFRWTTPKRSTVFFDSVEEMVEIHGHDGKTRVVWVESPSTPRQVQILQVKVEVDATALDRLKADLGDVEARVAKAVANAQRIPLTELFAALSCKTPGCAFPGGHLPPCGES